MRDRAPGQEACYVPQPRPEGGWSRRLLDNEAQILSSGVSKTQRTAELDAGAVVNHPPAEGRTIP